MKALKGWSIHRNDKYSQCSAWPRWIAGISNGRFGFGVIRERWGWRFMLGPWDACKFLDER